jgi:hypothetical protein
MYGYVCQFTVNIGLCMYVYHFTTTTTTTTTTTATATATARTDMLAFWIFVLCWEKTFFRRLGEASYLSIQSN